MAASKMKSFIAYMPAEDHMRLKKFAKQKKLAMTQLVREGVIMRMAEDTPYVAGYNDGVTAAIDAVRLNPAFKMKFPSGQSFEDLLVNELHGLRLLEAKV